MYPRLIIISGICAEDPAQIPGLTVLCCETIARPLLPYFSFGRVDGNGAVDALSQSQRIRSGHRPPPIEPSSVPSAAVFAGAVSKDTVSRAWRKVKSDWDVWNARSLAEEPIVRLILDGTVVRVRLDRKATSISLLVVIGVRDDGQKVLLAVKSMGGETTEAWRAVLDDLVTRALRRPEFLMVDGAPGLEKAIAAVWDGVPVQRCTVHKHRNLLAHAPERLHDEITADYTDMIYAATPEEIAVRRKAFIRKWRLRHRAVADSLEEAGERLFTFTRLPPSQWRSARTTNAIERLHEEFKRRIKTQTVLPSADTAAMLFWALLASGQINMRKVDGWQTLSTNPIDQPIDLAA
jgi:putative transposase